MVGYIKSLKIPIFFLCVLVYTPQAVSFFGPLRLGKLYAYGATLSAKYAAKKAVFDKQKKRLCSIFDQDFFFTSVILGCLAVPFASLYDSKEEKRQKKLTRRLFSAANNNNVAEAQMLLAKGAKPNFTARQVGLARQFSDSRWTPSHVAASRCHSQFFRVLAEHGADMTKKDKRGNSPDFYLAQCPV